jgi:hypothetical protein
MISPAAWTIFSTIRRADGWPNVIGNYIDEKRGIFFQSSTEQLCVITNRPDVNVFLLVSARRSLPAAKML